MNASDPTTLLKLWADADKAAALAETLLLERALAAIHGAAAAPTEAERKLAQLLRHKANELFVEAMEACDSGHRQLSRIRTRLHGSPGQDRS